VDLRSPLPARVNQFGFLEDGEVLGDGLSRQCAAVSHGQTRADLEQRLTIAERQFVQDRPVGSDQPAL